MPELIDNSVTIKLTRDEAEFLGKLLGKQSTASIEDAGLDYDMLLSVYGFFSGQGLADA